MENTLEDIVNTPMPNVTRLVVQHIPTRTFRWMGLIEVTVLVLAFCCVLLPVFLLLFIVTRGGIGLDALDLRLPELDRFHYTWHDIEIRALDANGTVQVRHRQRFEDADAAHLLVSSILQAADKQGLMVIETIGETLSSETTRWYGGRPLMMRPEVSTSDLLWSRLERARCTRHLGTQSTEIRYAEAHAGRLTLFIRILGLGLLFPLLLSAHNRRALRTAVAEYKTGSPSTWHVECAATHIRLSRTCGELTQWTQTIEGHTLLGVTWAPSLSYGRRARLNAPTLQFTTAQGRHHVHVPEALGRTLADYIPLEHLRRRAGHPSLGDTTGLAPATRCPYCGAVYVFTPGQGCEACGGWPDKVGMA